MSLFKGHRFIFVRETGANNLQIRYADDLRVNCEEDDPAQHDDHAFALALLEGVSSLAYAEDVTLCVFVKERE